MEAKGQIFGRPFFCFFFFGWQRKEELLWQSRSNLIPPNKRALKQLINQ